MLTYNIQFLCFLVECSNRISEPVTDNTYTGITAHLLFYSIILNYLNRFYTI